MSAALPSWRKADSWASAVLLGSQGGSDDDDEDPPSAGSAADAGLAQVVAGEAFCDLLVELKLVGKISAHICCVLAHFAAEAGACGPARQLGRKPDLQTGKYSAHFDAFLGHREDDEYFYWVPTPLRCTYDGERSTRSVDIAIALPHEVLVQELADAGMSA